MLVIAAITILLGSAMALLQDDLKRRLAYSSIAQIGYIILGVFFLLNEQGLGRRFVSPIYPRFYERPALLMCRCNNCPDRHTQYQPDERYRAENAFDHVFLL
jgi:hypothetical protein